MSHDWRRAGAALGVVAVLSVPLPSQAQPRNLATIAIAGPARWHRCVQPTNVGSLVANADGAPVWRDWVAHLDGVLAELAGENAAAARARLLGYDGALRVRLLAKPAALADEPAELSFALALDADDPTATTTRDLVRDVARWVEHFVGTDTVAEGHVLLLDAQAALAIDATGALQVDAAPALAQERGLLTGTLVRLDIDVETAIDLGFRDPQLGAVARALAGSMRRVVVEFGADGPHVSIAARFEYGPGPRGLADALWPVGHEAADFTALVPADALAATSLRIDARALWRTLLAARAALTDTTADEQVRRWNAATGIDIDKDLLAHLDGDVELMLLPAAASQRAGLLDGLVVAAHLRDQAGVAAALPKLLESLGAFVDRSGDELTAWSMSLFGEQHCVRSGFWFFGPRIGQERFDTLTALADHLPRTLRRQPRQTSVDIDFHRLVGERIGATALLLRGLFGSSFHVNPGRIQGGLQRLQPLLERCDLLHARASLAVSGNLVDCKLSW